MNEKESKDQGVNVKNGVWDVYFEFSIPHFF
jgi:hypothetical protein